MTDGHSGEEGLEAKSTNNDNAAANAAPMGGGNGAMGNAQSRSEIVRLWTADFRNGDDLTGADRSYVAQVVAARTGISQADAEKRVNEVVTEAKSASIACSRSAGLMHAHASSVGARGASAGMDGSSSMTALDTPGA